MRIVRFTAPIELGIGTDPLFGVLNDKDAADVQLPFDAATV